MSAASWEVRFSKSRSRAYFYNVDTQESRWEPPAELTDEDISQLKGAELLSAAAAPAATGSGSSGKVQASHILVKHEGSRRPSSWKEVRPVLALIIMRFGRG
jgi:NIMA-interacting peptidyl-prolyl cis-trans isomerase 1